MGQKILVYTTVFVLLVYAMGSGSCANTSTPPMGGPKDTIPPVLLSVEPAPGSVDIPLEGTTITLKFDEYIAPLKDVLKEVFISPPLEKNVVAKLRGKGVVVSFETPLDSATTYTLSFGNSIVDNNEGNKFSPYTITFSTGSHIDSMLCSGYILDALTLQPVYAVKTALYKDHSDSVIYNTLPSAMSKTDSSGYFVIRNIPSKDYQAFAFIDENNNNRYDPGSEMVAFLDSLIYPTKVLKDSMPELKPYNRKDSTAAPRPGDYTMYLFKEDPFVQFIRDSKRPEERRVTIGFGAPKAQVTSVSFDGIDSSAILREFNLRRDTLDLWIADRELKLPDTLKLAITYYKSDSLRNLSPITEQLKLVYNKKDTLKPLEVTIKSSPETINRDGFVISLPEPLVSILHDSIKLELANVRGDPTRMPYEIVKDTASHLKYRIVPKELLTKGSKLTLTIPEGSFTGTSGATNKAVNSDVSIPTDNKLSSLSLSITAGIEGRVIVELMDDKKKTVHQSSFVEGTADTKLEFPYIKAGKYSIRISHDANGNGIIDPGNIRERKQPEKVIIYTLPDGNNVIIVGEGMEIEQIIDLKLLF